MNNTDIIVQDTNRKGIDLCNCPKCKGCAGTARVCFNSRKLALRALGNALTKTAGLLLLLACSAPQGQAAPDDTSPGKRTFSGPSDQASFGYLKVFSSTQESQWGEGSHYYPHTGYRIYDANGKTVKWVDNHNSSIDEDPQKVELAPGTYTIWAQSDKAGYVKMPVVIKPARTTVVHLETSHR